MTLVFAGPTGSGKSALALKIAQQIGGEIICADSRQIYKNMPIMAACPTAEDYAAVPHHGYERLEPGEVYSAGDFIRDTDTYVAEIKNRQKTPILVGGTGLYLRAWRFGLDDVLPADEAIRKNLDSMPSGVLYGRLIEVDPGSTRSIQPADTIRIKRALEIYELTGKPASELRQTDWSRNPRVEASWYLLDPPGPELDQRLHNRVKHMFEAGLVEEALALQSIPPETPGYTEALQLAHGEITKTDAIERVFRRHRQYAKRQHTWFKKEPWWQKLTLAQVAEPSSWLHPQPQ
jgi:tRNA dimethylallyltransferase